MQQLALRTCGCTFLLDCDDESATLVRAVFGGFVLRSTTHAPGVSASWHVARDSSGHGFQVSEADGSVVRLEDADELLFHLDKSLTLALQYQRPELYFLHAATVAIDGRVAVLPAPRGTGKSTLTLALTERGCVYLSDELAAVDVRTLTVHPYARALCLKSAPPHPCELPPETLRTGRRLYVPVSALRGGFHRDPLPVAALIFIGRNGAPWTCRPVTPATAVARLRANALNPLAHEGDGLDVAVALGQQVGAFDLDSTSLEEAGAAVEEILLTSTPRPARNVLVPFG